MQSTTRKDWQRYCDHYGSNHKGVTVSWYESELHRLRLALHLATGTMTLFTNSGHGWREIDTAVWDIAQMTPSEIAHRARSVLWIEKEKRFVELTPADGVNNRVGCRKDGRLATVRR